MRRWFLTRLQQFKLSRIFRIDSVMLFTLYEFCNLHRLKVSSKLIINLTLFCPCCNFLSNCVASFVWFFISTILTLLFDHFLPREHCGFELTLNGEIRILSPELYKVVCFMISHGNFIHLQRRSFQRKLEVRFLGPRIVDPDVLNTVPRYLSLEQCHERFSISLGESVDDFHSWHGRLLLAERFLSCSLADINTCKLSSWCPVTKVDQDSCSELKEREIVRLYTSVFNNIRKKYNIFNNICVYRDYLILL